MDNTELQSLVEKISLTFFQRPFRHQAIFNKRLRAVGGRYLTKTHHLEFNHQSFEMYGIDELISIIKHELCHYHLHLEGKGYLHRDKSFKECLKQVGGSRFAKPLNHKIEMGYRYQLTCKKCNQIYLRKKRMNPTAYRCGKCGGTLLLNNLKVK